MSEKIYLNLLILCGILFQGSVGTFLEDNHIPENSSNLHFRKKRLVYHSSEHSELSIADVPYIVKILQNGTRNCAGILITPIHILTIKLCVDDRRTVYTFESGEMLISTVKTHYARRIYSEGRLAVVLIDPDISVDSPSLHRNIQLFEGSVPPFTLATISGLAPRGSRYIDGMDVPYFRQLTNVSIISLQTCFNYYLHHNYGITNDDICTIEFSGVRGCTPEDGGSALVVDEKLVGVLIFAGSITGQWGPDVFIRVNDNNIYHMWIKKYINSYNLYSRNATRKHHPRNQYPHTQHPHTSH